LLSDVMRMAYEFFEFPMEERQKFISEDMMKLVTYNTSFNYLRGQVVCWRDFMKNNCHPLEQMLPLWKEAAFFFLMVVVTMDLTNYCLSSKTFIFLLFIHHLLKSLGDLSCNIDVVKVRLQMESIRQRTVL
jgi:hypothetical protein